MSERCLTGSKTVVAVCLILFCLALVQSVSLDKHKNHARVGAHRARLRDLSKKEAKILGERTALEHMLAAAKTALAAEERKGLTENEREHDNDIANLNLKKIIGMITNPVETVPHSAASSAGTSKRESWINAANEARMFASPVDPITTVLHQHATPLYTVSLDAPDPHRFAEEQRRHMMTLGVGTGGSSSAASPAAGKGGAGSGGGDSGNNNPTYILPIDPYNYMPFFNAYSNVNPFASFYPTPQSPLANNPSIPWRPQIYSNPNMFGPNPNYPWTTSPYPLYVAPGEPGAGQTNPQLLYPFGMSPFPPPPPPASSSYSWLQISQSPRALRARSEAVARHMNTPVEDIEERKNSIDQSVVHVHPTHASSNPKCDGCLFKN